MQRVTEPRPFEPVPCLLPGGNFMYRQTLDIIGLWGIRKPTLDFAPQIRETDAMRGEVEPECVQGFTSTQ